MRKLLFSAYCVGLALAFLLLRAPACSGVQVDAPARPPGPGEVAVVEVMADPLPGQPEWVELAHLGEGRLALAGCTLSDGGTAGHVAYLPPETWLQPGERLVVAEAALGLSLPALVELGEDALVLAEDDPDEVLRVHCPGEDGALQLVDDVVIGALAPAPRGHSWMLAQPLGGALDDDPARWCVAGIDAPFGEEPQYGTPGEANACPEAAGEVPRPGDLRITELMVAPWVGREWLELTSEAGVVLDLAGCTLAEGGDGAPHEHVLDPARGGTVLDPGATLLLAASSPELTPGGVVADYAYSSLTFNNDVAEELWLSCGDQEIERVAYDWAASGGERGRALSRDPGGDGGWCLAEEPFFEDGEVVEFGTPGWPNPPCGAGEPAADAPAAGELVISELMIAPSQGTLFPEWLEVVNVSPRELSLDGCRIEDDGHAAALTAEGPLLPGGIAVLSRGSFDPSCAIEVHGQYGGSVTFNNGEPDRCALVCPAAEGWVTVDEVWFDWTGWDLDKGWSLGLDAGAVDADGNDDPSRWCAAPPDGWSCTLQGHVDRGTPGELTSCP